MSGTICYILVILSQFAFLSCSQGFDEYMNIVLDDAEELSVKHKTRTSVGRILLKGQNITLIMAA